MLGKWKKSKIFKVIDYLAERKARSTINDLIELHSRNIQELNSGTIETIQKFRDQHDQQISILKREEKRSTDNLHHETEKKIKAISDESSKIQTEMSDAINQLSKEMSRVMMSEHVYETGFAEITFELKKMLPQIRASLQAIQVAASNIESIHQNVQSEVGKIKKSTKAEDIIQKNRMRAR